MMSHSGCWPEVGSAGIPLHSTKCPSVCLLFFMVNQPLKKESKWFETFLLTCWQWHFPLHMTIPESRKKTREQMNDIDLSCHPLAALEQSWSLQGYYYFNVVFFIQHEITAETASFQLHLVLITVIIHDMQKCWTLYLPRIRHNTFCVAINWVLIFGFECFCSFIYFLQCILIGF